MRGRGTPIMLMLVGQAVPPAIRRNARIPQKVASFPSSGSASIPDLAPMGIFASRSAIHGVPNSRKSLRRDGPFLGPACLGTDVAPRSAHRGSGGYGDHDRRLRAALLSTLCMGGDAKPRAFTGGSSGSGPGADAIAQRLNGPRRESDPGSHRTAVLARRVIRPLLTECRPSQSHHSLHRGEPGFGGSGECCGGVAVVERRMAGGTACPTNFSHDQN